MLNRGQVTRRVARIIKDNSYSDGEYHQWATAVMPAYQDLLVEMELDHVITPVFLTDHWIDGLEIRKGRQTPVELPDPWWLRYFGREKGKKYYRSYIVVDINGRKVYIKDVVDFFLKLQEEK